MTIPTINPKNRLYDIGRIIKPNHFFTQKFYGFYISKAATMNLKKSILAIAAIMAISTISFAGSKNDANANSTKKTEPTETKVKVEGEVSSTAGQILFWYSDDGTQALGQGEEPSGSECGPTGAGCAKGYTSSQSTPVPSTTPAAQTRGDRE